MALSFVDGTINYGGSGSSISLSIGTNFAVGQAVVGVCSYVTSTGTLADIASISDGVVTWSNAQVYDYNSNSDDYATFTFFLPYVTPGQNTITINLSGTSRTYSSIGVAFHVIAGAAGGYGSAHSINFQANLASSPTSSGSITPKANNCYIYTVVVPSGIAPSSTTAPSGFTTVNNSSSVEDAYEVQTTATSVNGAWGETTGSFYDYISAIIAVSGVDTPSYFIGKFQPPKLYNRLPILSADYNPRIGGTFETNQHYIGRFQPNPKYRLPILSADVNPATAPTIYYDVLSVGSGEVLAVGTGEVLSVGQENVFDTNFSFIGRFTQQRFSRVILSADPNPATQALQPETNQHFIGRFHPAQFARAVLSFDPNPHTVVSFETNQHFIGRFKPTQFARAVLSLSVDLQLAVQHDQPLSFIGRFTPVRLAHLPSLWLFAPQDFNAPAPSAPPVVYPRYIIWVEAVFALQQQLISALHTGVNPTLAQAVYLRGLFYLQTSFIRAFKTGNWYPTTAGAPNGAYVGGFNEDRVATWIAYQSLGPGYGQLPIPPLKEWQRFGYAYRGVNQKPGPTWFGNGW